MKPLGENARTGPLKVEFESCPVQASLGILGRKWALLILRNMALFDKHRFSELLKVTPGLTKRVLSMRLKELEDGGYIQVVDKGVNYSKWDLTEKGRDTLPVLMALVQFGSKWYADQVFLDKKPRTLKDVFEDSYIQAIMRDFMVELSVPSYVRVNKH